MILAHSKSELYIVDSDRDHIALEYDGKSAVRWLWVKSSASLGREAKVRSSVLLSMADLDMKRLGEAELKALKKLINRLDKAPKKGTKWKDLSSNVMRLEDDGFLYYTNDLFITELKMFLYLMENAENEKK